jgi:4-hydroxy-tetrahydrodipicolinate reductase
MSGVAIFGITGRMGQSLIRILRESSNTHLAPLLTQSTTLRLTGAIASPGSGRLGRDAAADGDATGVTITADAVLGLAGAAVAVDFSLPQCVAANVRVCAAAGVPFLVGTTGFDAAARAALEQAAKSIPVLIAPNTSLGVNVMAQLVQLAALKLGVGYDVEITEAHHRMKRDAPSGTALALGKAIAEARGETLANVAVFDRHGTFAPREAGSIGFAVVRAGDIVGEHTVTFAAAGERIEITHRATDRATFARGALRAAAWLVGRPAGLYGMENVLDHC